VAVLTESGQPIGDYVATLSTEISTDALAPGAQVTWGGKSLPAGPFRLRFDLTGGDLYAYTITG
jgi:hypothetical protein